MESSFYYINVPSIMMREGPSLESEVNSQACYAERVSLLETKKGFLKIATPDGYVGWVEEKPGVIYERAVQYASHLPARIITLWAHLYSIKDTVAGPAITLPYGTTIEWVKYEDERWAQASLLDGTLVYIQRGDLSASAVPKSIDEMIAFARTIPALPYTWGGRCTLPGFDCSGLVQMLYREMGVLLPRDSKDQACCHLLHDVSLESIVPGDLIFFGNQEKRITHVALSLGGDRFLHTSPRENKPWVRESSLSDAAWNGSLAATSYRIARRYKLSC